MQKFKRLKHVVLNIMTYGYQIFLSIFFFLLFTSLKVQAQEVTVRFFDEQNQLLDTQILDSKSPALLPSYTREGYIFHGYNTQPDGSGEWIADNVIYEDQDYYAILSKRSYHVSYYLEDTLLQTVEVPYMELPPDIPVDEKEGYEFRGWVIEEICEDTYLYSGYDKSPVDSLDDDTSEEGEETIDETVVDETKEVVEEVETESIREEEVVISKELIYADGDRKEVLELPKFKKNLKNKKSDSVADTQSNQVDNKSQHSKSQSLRWIYIVFFLSVFSLSFIILSKLIKNNRKK